MSIAKAHYLKSECVKLTNVLVHNIIIHKNMNKNMLFS